MKLDRIRRTLKGGRLVLTGVAALAIAGTVSGLLATQAPASKAAAHTQATQKVIVQMASSAATEKVQAAVAQLGGEVTKDLHIINAFAVTVPAQKVADVAKVAGVKHVTPDGAMVPTEVTHQFTTWATRLGTSKPTTFTNAAMVVDSAAGPNGTYAYGAKATASVGGFSSAKAPVPTQALPIPDVVSKVEVVLHAYVLAQLADKQDVSISVVLKGTVLKTYTLGHDKFDHSIGAQYATDLYLDVTNAQKTWNFSDLDGALEVQINQSAFTAPTPVYYDAVGLRVTSKPGTSCFTTWGTSGGFGGSSCDSTMGANGTYVKVSNKKADFKGFTAEITPGTVISKVEVALVGYVPLKLTSYDNAVISVSLGSLAGTTVTLDHGKWDHFVGSAYPGTVYVDVTKTRVWQWSDFDQDLKLRIDQSLWLSTSLIYYDAVGFRVTTTNGLDPTADVLTADTEKLAAQPIITQKNVYNDAIGATKVWNEPGYLQGNKVLVAVVDSGCGKTEDLDARAKKNISVNAAFHNSTDFYGHGTFVAGLVAGNGKVSKGLYKGVAPKANVLNVRVADDQGSTSESDVVAGLQWIYDNHDKYQIRVVNLSLNSSVAQSFNESPLDAACEILWFSGVTVVTSAGNMGEATLYPPANDPFVITVGATDDKGTVDLADDVVVGFSSYGVSEVGSVKPELVAPGTHIVGLLPENDKHFMSLSRMANRIDKTYFKMSGTSMSAPIVTGAIALLLQKEPTLTPDQVKYRLMATANKAWPGYDPAKAGAGYLDIWKAVHTTTTQSANTGTPLSAALNTGTAPLTWNSIDWERAVHWNDVDWQRAVHWNDIEWQKSVKWNSDYWGD